jgi:two-component system OmpR family sensor kinase
VKLRRTSLISTLLASVVLPGALAIVVGAFIVYSVVREEYGELQDNELAAKSQLLLKLYRTTPPEANDRDRVVVSDALDVENAQRAESERSLFWVLDAGGRVVMQSPGADPALLPDDLKTGFDTANDHRFFTLRSDEEPPVRLVLAVTLRERNSTIREAVFAVLFGFLLLSSVFVAIAFRSVRRSVGVIENLARNISEKNEHNLSPVDRENSFAEIEPAIDTLDTLMARLDKALSAERAFATNAAHELRTPVAVAIAQVQRLKASLKDPAASRKIAEIEAALKRLVRLTERLLQLSRTQAGLGSHVEAYDVSEVLTLLLTDLREREPSGDRLDIRFPMRDCITTIDPDALGIMLNNLLDNALKHAPARSPIVVDASEGCRVEVVNDCDPLSGDDLAAVTRRFIRRTSSIDGFGLGLSIVQQLCEQSGCSLEVISPLPGTSRGFKAILNIPERVGADGSQP